MNHENPRNETQLKGIPKKIGKWALAAAVIVGSGAGLGVIDNHSGYDKSSYRPSTATKTVETTTSMDTEGAPAFKVPEGSTLTPTETTTQTVTESTQPADGPNQVGGDPNSMNNGNPVNPGSTN